MFGITSYNTGSLDCTPHFYFLLSVLQTATTKPLQENILNSNEPEHIFLGTPLWVQPPGNQNREKGAAEEDLQQH